MRQICMPFESTINFRCTKKKIVFISFLYPAYFAKRSRIFVCLFAFFVHASSLFAYRIALHITCENSFAVNFSCTTLLTTHHHNCFLVVSSLKSTLFITINCLFVGIVRLRSHCHRVWNYALFSSKWRNMRCSHIEINSQKERER